MVLDPSNMLANHLQGTNSALLIGVIRVTSFVGGWSTASISLGGSGGEGGLADHLFSFGLWGCTNQPWTNLAQVGILFVLLGTAFVSTGLIPWWRADRAVVNSIFTVSTVSLPVCNGLLLYVGRTSMCGALGFS